MCADADFDYSAAYPYLCYSLARSAGGLSTFSILVRLSTSARLRTCLFGLRSRPRGLIFICFALHVPKPMFVFAFEGALFALTYNGDRFVLFALLPRRKPRTSVSAAALSFQRTQPHQRRLLRFACAIWSLAWISCIVTVAPLPYINPSKSLLGFTVLFCEAGAALTGRAFSS